MGSAQLQLSGLGLYHMTLPVQQVIGPGMVMCPKDNQSWAASYPWFVRPDFKDELLQSYLWPWSLELDIQRGMAKDCCSVVQSCPTLMITWTVAFLSSLSFTISWSLLKLMSIELVMPSNHLILCHPLLLPSIFPSIRVFSNVLDSLHLVAKVLELQHQSFQWIFSVDFL